jgi:threonine synthase
MMYVSTRGMAPALDFERAMMTGLASDGGLYVPEAVPVMTAAQIARWRACPSRRRLPRHAPLRGRHFGDEEFRG